MNRTAPGNGGTLERILGIIESRGVPLLITAGLFVGVCLYVPPIVRSHLHSLDVQIEKLDSMDSTLNELAEAPYPREDFRTRVYDEHAEQIKAAQQANAALDVQSATLRSIADTLDRVSLLLEAAMPLRGKKDD